MSAAAPTLVDTYTLPGGAAEISRYRLDNGLTVLLWEDHTAPVFAFHTWLKVGSRHERPGKTGIAHLFEHMMFKATANHPEGEFDSIMERHGAQTNAATWVDWTYYREKLPSGQLELVCQLEADRMEHLLLNDTQLESEREVVKNERLMRVDNDPEGQLYETLYATAYTQHSYGWPTIGWMADIEGLTLEDCNAFYETYYSPNNATIVIVGDFVPSEALGLISRYYGHLAPRAIPAELSVAEPPQHQERRKTLALPLSAPKVVVGYHAPAVTDPDHAALEVLCEVLTGGDSARLYARMVTDLELATEAVGWTAAWAAPGLFELALTLQPGVGADAALAALDAVLDELVTAPITAREVTKAVNGLEAGALRGAADTGSRARRLGHAEATVGDYRWYWQHQAALCRVTPEDVQAVARRVLRRDNRTVIFGVPKPAPEDAEVAS